MVAHTTESFKRWKDAAVLEAQEYKEMWQKHTQAMLQKMI